ncbi:hypothetical protein Pint_24656 [Pistacia integerrima]|uniref:Uncharacterized protein n=1 Tax=Pistacia integerrima TaxID=434235 RepID=A0ACC0YI08_9ROSI|nr:hypothetical protein Pint_24656 [Pistacia integerrima]
MNFEKLMNSAIILKFVCVVLLLAEDWCVTGVLQLRLRMCWMLNSSVVTWMMDYSALVLVNFTGVNEEAEMLRCDSRYDAIVLVRYLDDVFCVCVFLLLIAKMLSILQVITMLKNLLKILDAIAFTILLECSLVKIEAMDIELKNLQKYVAECSLVKIEAMDIEC